MSVLAVNWMTNTAHAGTNTCMISNTPEFQQMKQLYGLYRVEGVKIRMYGV